MKDAKWLDELKLRLGWGMTGQQNGIPDFYYTPVYTVSDTYAQYPFGDKYYITMRPSAYNPELTWEKTTTYNAGLDFTALNGRFGMNVDGYYRKTTDLLSTIAIAGGTNFGDQLLKNIGSLENYGVELAFDVKPIVTKDFIWDVTYNVGWNHNEITQLDAGLQDWVWTGDKVSRGNNTKIQVNKVGQPINSFYVSSRFMMKTANLSRVCMLTATEMVQSMMTTAIATRALLLMSSWVSPPSSSIRTGTSVQHSMPQSATMFITIS